MMRPPFLAKAIYGTIAPMKSIVQLLQKGWEITRRRIGEQGLIVTLVWIYGRGLPALTGVPIWRFSRITPQLYVGPQYRINGLRSLKLEGIDAVVNMRVEKDDQILGLAPARYCYLPTIDDDAPSMEHLAKGVRFIDEVIRSGGKVYIHCGAGVGRAPTMAAAYLISMGHKPDEAISIIRKVRPFIYIMPVQLQQLERFASSQR
jgi:hypothetical protein